VPQPQGWLAEARLLEAAADTLPDADLADRARALLTTLDDAELAAWAARHFGRPDPGLEASLADCTAWVRDHPDLFLLCGTHVQAVGQALRPDLPGFDLVLAWTADKYVVILDDLEQAEQTWSSGPGPAVAPAERAGDWSWLPEPALLMAARRGGPPPPLLHADWRSRDGHTATLALDPLAPGVRVNFYTGDNGATDLTGEVAVLAGVARRIDSAGNAEFDRAELEQARAAGRPDSLRLESSGEEWVRIYPAEEGS
jgi:hypothetical protein